MLRGGGDVVGYEEGELQLEEGEAPPFDGAHQFGHGYGGHGEPFDPDAPTHVDERLQRALGRFRKRYEGEISAKNLGSQYGEHGSFLPTYPRSPLAFPQCRSPTDPSNRGSASRSYLPMEITQKNNFVMTGLDRSRKIEYSRTSNESNGIPSQQMLNTTVNGSEQRAPKIRIKVNGPKSLASTAAIYSGLGLDITPSSSTENSPDPSAGAPAPEVSPDDSPHTIFEIMTCHSIPGGLLLSPLAGNILELREKPKAMIKYKAPELHDDKAELHRDWGLRTSASLDNKDQIAKAIKSGEKKDRIPNFKSARRRVNNPLAANEGTSNNLQDMSDDTGSNFSLTIIKTQHSVEKLGKSMNEISDQLKATKTLKGHIIEKNKVCNKDPSLDHGFLGKIRYGSDEYNDQLCTSSSHRQKIPLEKVKENVVHVKEELSQFESKDMGSLFTRNDDGNSSGMIKGKKKKISSSQTTLSGKKLKVKAQKQLNDDITRKSYGEDEDHAVGHGIDLTNLYKKDRSVKLEKKIISSGETSNKSDGGNAVDLKIPPLFDEKSDSFPSVCRNVTTESSMVTAVPAPIVINEQWVCCDKCEKWRLLPYGVNPEKLPKKWRCSMQSWLPGMNSCKISEDETTRALRALPSSENNIQNGGHDIAISGIGTTTASAFEGNIQSIDTLGKLKSSHDGANVANNLDLCDMPKPSKKQYATMNRKPHGGDCFPKLKEKRKQAESSGEIIGKDQPHQMKSSVGVDQDNLRASKKMKKESNGPLEHYPTEFEIRKNSPSVNETLKNMQKHSNISPGMRKYGSSSSGMRSLGEDQGFSNAAAKKSDKENSVLLDLSIKKRKSKQRLSDQHGLDPQPNSTAANCTMKQTFGETNVVKKKPRPELKLSKVDRTATHARGTVAGVDDDDMLSAEKECLSEQRQENTRFQYPENTTRRISGHAQTSAAATSSSSKVSNSHKSKADFQETRASPVESVSSSPLRTFDKNALDQRKCYSWAVAVNVHSQESGKKGSSRSKRNYDIVSGSDQAKAHANRDIGHHVQKDRHLLKDKQDLTNACLIDKDSEPSIKNVRLNPEQNVNSDALTSHDSSDHKHPVSRQNGKTPPDLSSNRSDHANLTFGNTKADKGNMQHNNLKINPSTAKASKQQELLNNVSNGDSLYKAKQIGKAGTENLETRKQVTLSGDGSNLTNVSVLLKEARDLKHLSKRLKEKGDDFESTSMCFEAGLKFLHVASLCEAPNIDGSIQGDSIQAMKLYSETGNLCGFCAHEFERLKKMANAALAYKCMEVAYMKAAFFKHPGAIKDRHALQAASLMVPPAESPSSSASDVDNLNNQSTVAKAVSARSIYSPQIASNPISRNNHQLMGLLSYVEDINNAFDGTRKSQNSFSAYLSGIGKNQVTGVALVREVLDFSFHNVKGLLQLIRHSLEYINRESVK